MRTHGQGSDPYGEVLLIQFTVQNLMSGNIPGPNREMSHAIQYHLGDPESSHKSWVQAKHHRAYRNIQMNKNEWNNERSSKIPGEWKWASAALPQPLNRMSEKGVSTPFSHLHMGSLWVRPFPFPRTQQWRFGGSGAQSPNLLWDQEIIWSLCQEKTQVTDFSPWNGTNSQPLIKSWLFTPPTTEIKILGLEQWWVNRLSLWVTDQILQAFDPPQSDQ